MKRMMAVIGLVVAVIAGQVMADGNAVAEHARKTPADRDKVKAEREAKKAERETRKAALEQKKEEHKDKVDEAKAAHEEKKEELKTKVEEKKTELSEKASDRVDQRQENQEKRIQHGISKGYLTADEVTKLQGQQQEIANLETTALADGKLSKDEFKSIRDELNEASACIWGEKHDTDGNQMAAYRLGKNVFAKAELTSMLADETMSPDQAKALMKDFRSLTEMKSKLSTDDLSDADRAALQAQYDELLNKYFEVR